MAAMGVAFFVHLAYDVVAVSYEGFQTTFLILGFVGLALGVDLMGRKG